MLCITGYKTQSSLFVALVSKLDCETRGMIVHNLALTFQPMRKPFHWHPIKHMYIHSCEVIQLLALKPIDYYLLYKTEKRK